jgi:NAD-dependent deacetylase
MILPRRTIWNEVSKPAPTCGACDTGETHETRCDPQRGRTQRRKAVLEAFPNPAHRIVAELESEFEVTVIIQSVDDLHERAGSHNIIHLHGSLLEARSTKNPNLIHSLNRREMQWGDLCAEGAPLRPNIVWFNEEVPKMGQAKLLTESADAFVVVGTSLVVYPAASLLDFVKPGIPKLVVDPNHPAVPHEQNVEFIEQFASAGMETARARLRQLLS